MSIIFPDGPLVTVKWLEINHQQVTLLDCSVTRSEGVKGKTEFSSGYDTFLMQHLPEAQFADLFGKFSADDAEFAFTAPNAHRLSQALQALGLHPDSLIVVYDQLNGAYAARVWYLLAGVYGLDNVRVLDGGFKAWLKQARSVETGPAQTVARGTLQVRFTRPLLRSTEQVGQEKSVPLLCALRREQFQQAHIPGSISLPYPELLNNEGLIDIASVRAVLQGLEIQLPQPLLLYCGGGINAAGLALALVAAGYPIDSLFLYDDSLNGWLSDSKRPVASGDN